MVFVEVECVVVVVDDTVDVDVVDGVVVDVAVVAVEVVDVAVVTVEVVAVAVVTVEVVVVAVVTVAVVDEPTVCESIGEGACTYPGIAEAVQTMCPKACNVCRSPLPRDCHGVKDLGGCDQLLKSHCTDRLLGPQVSKHCQLFCGTCPAEPLTTTATTTTTEDSFRIPTCNGNPDPNLCKGITSALCNAPKEAGELLKANCPALCNTCASEEPLCHGVPDAARCGTDTSLCSDPRAGGDARVQCPALCGTCPEDPPTLPPTSTASTTSTEVLYVCNGVRDPDECANDIDLVMCSDWQWGTQISEFCPAMCGVCESGRFSTTAPPTPSVATSSTPVATTCNGFEDPEQCSSYNKAVCEFVAEGLAIAPILLKTCPVLCGTCPDVITSTVPTTTTVVRATGNVDGNVDDCADFGSTRIKLNGREASCSKLKAEGFCEEIDTLPFAFRGEFRDSVWAVCPKSCQACPGDTNGATTTMPCVDNENGGLYINSTLASCVSIKSSGYCTYENLSTMPGTLRDHFWRSIVKQCPMTCNLCGHIFTTEAVPLQTSTAESSTTETATATATATTTSSSTSTMATETTTVTTTSSTTGTTATETTAATTASSTTETSTTEIQHKIREREYTPSSFSIHKTDE